MSAHESARPTPRSHRSPTSSSATSPSSIAPARAVRAPRCRGPRREDRARSAAPARRDGRGATPEIDGAGTTLMPGLTDAHVHFALIGPRGDHGDEP